VLLQVQLLQVLVLGAGVLTASTFSTATALHL
jgi:hypothetical protein